MSNPADLRIERSLELVNRLKTTGQAFAKREEQLQREYRQRRVATDRKQGEEATAAEERSAAELAEAESSLATEESRIKSIHSRRASRIQRIHTNSVRDVLAGAQRAKEKVRGELQMKHLETERSLPLKLKAIETEFGQFTTKLAEQRTRLESLNNATVQAFAGYAAFTKLLQPQPKSPEEDGPPNPVDRDQWFSGLSGQLDMAEAESARFNALPIPKLFRYLPLPILLPMIAVVATGYALTQGFSSQSLLVAGGIFVLGALITFVLYQVGRKQGQPGATAIATALRDATKDFGMSQKAGMGKLELDRKTLKDEYHDMCTRLQEQWDESDEMDMDLARDTRSSLEKKLPRALATNERQLRKRLQILGPKHTKQLEELRQTIASSQEALGTRHAAAKEQLTTDEANARATLVSEWQREMGAIYQEIDALSSAASTTFPPWSQQLVEDWTAPKSFSPAIKFGQLKVDIAGNSTDLPATLPLPGPAQVSLPISLNLPDHGSLLFETNDSATAGVEATLNNVVLRLLANTPPGKVAFTIIDPVGLGKNFAGLMHLTDYEESLINRRIWTQRDQIEERLGELNAHIEKVIQMYLRNEFATITEYNEQAGSVAEKLHFLIVADFPSTFSDTAAARLQSIAMSGPRCGVFTLLHWDRRQAQPDGFVSEELRRGAITIKQENGRFILAKQQEAGVSGELTFDPPPDSATAASLVHKIGKASVDSNRVEVPFTQVAPKPDEFWQQQTTSELRVAVGRTGATKLQYLAIGKGTRQHALFAGKTGSGKSTLFHVIITNLALSCSPDEVEFYLIDFKKGVEFKCYAAKRLPHARVVAIESDREFGLSVLQRVDDELKRRGDLFRKMGVQDIAGYKRAGGTEPIPRSLLIIDEFQEFFVEDDDIAQNVSVLFDRIVRQGRAFGIHVLLGSQTLGGAYTLARATLGQMVIRVALQCNEADSHLIMDDSNSAPRLLSRPGEGIYNDAAGAVEGNSPFQVVWLPDDERDTWLDKVHELSAERSIQRQGPIVFEGNAPADIHENYLLRSAIESHPTTTPAAGRCWFGAPNSIKGPTEATFHRQSGNHLLIVGQRDEAALALLGVSLISLAAQHPLGSARFFFFHNATPGSAELEFLERIFAIIPHGVTVAQGNDVVDAMNTLGAEFKARTSGDAPADAPAIYVFVHGLQKFKKLRQEDEFSFSSSDSDTPAPGTQFNNLVTEGSTVGMHLITTIDTFNNVNRSLSRKAQSEFEMRIVFQMSANDSASLIDSPKASGLGLHRALLYNEQHGTLETFRPYAMPDAEWIAEAGRKLARS